MRAREVDRRSKSEDTGTEDRASGTPRKGTCQCHPPGGRWEQRRHWQGKTLASGTQKRGWPVPPAAETLKIIADTRKQPPLPIEEVAKIPANK